MWIHGREQVVNELGPGKVFCIGAALGGGSPSVTFVTAGGTETW